MKPFSFLAAALWRLGYLIDSRTRLAPKKGATFTTPLMGVGSLLAGGAGKTPYTAYIAEKLKRMGFNVAILCKNTGDENLWFKRKGFEVFCGNRFELCKKLDKRFDILISDDGMEDRRLSHAFWICLTWGEGANSLRNIIPYGNCRSLWKDHHEISCIKKCAMRGSPTEADADLIFFMDMPVNMLGNTLNSQAIAIAGIAEPERFFNGLRHLGCNIIQEIKRPDHDKNFAFIIRKMLEKNMPIVITEKDSVKLSDELLNKNIYISKLNVKEVSRLL